MSDLDLEGIVRSRLKLNSAAFELRVIQEPSDGRALAKQEKTRGARWPLDPPPVIEFNCHDNDKNRTYLHSPFWFCTAELDTISSSGHSASPANGLSGTTVSSLHKVKLNDNREERGFFIFGDLNIKNAGMHRIRFSLFEMRQGSNGCFAEQLNSVYSTQFKVHPAKTHLPQRESTMLSRTLCEAGVKLRIRKESTKRKSQCIDWSADKTRHINYHGHILPPPYAAMPPPARPLHVQAGQPYQSAGENVTHRLSVSGTSLGIREHLDKVGQPAPIRPMASYKRSDNWGEAQQHWQTFHWNQEQAQAQAQSQAQARSQAQGFYATPTNTPGPDHRPPLPSFTNGNYQMAQQVSPPSPYSIGSNNPTPWDQGPLRAEGPLLFDQQPFNQAQRHSDLSPHAIGPQDPAQMPAFAMGPFSNPNIVAFGGAQASTHPAYSTGTNRYPMASTAGGENGGHY